MRFGPSIVLDETLTISGTGTVYGTSITFGNFIAGGIIVSGAGSSPNVAFYLEQSDDVPVTENASDSGYVVVQDLPFVSGGSASGTLTVAAEGRIISSLNPVATKRMRLKAVGGEGNDAGGSLMRTIITKQEES